LVKNAKAPSGLAKREAITFTVPGEPEPST
jgi:hypothetical protein